MKTASLLLLAPALVLGSNISTTCSTVSIDKSSGVLSALCSGSSGGTYFSQLDLNKCLAFAEHQTDEKTGMALMSEANGNFTSSCSACSVVSSPSPDQLSCSCSNSNSTLTYTYDLTTLVTNSYGCAGCLSATASVCMAESGFGVGQGSTNGGSSGSGGSSFSGSGSSGGSSFSGQSAGSSDVTLERKFRA